MDTRTGQLYTEEESKEAIKQEAELKNFLARVNIPLTKHQQETSKVGRNEPCPCGSGKKFKYCHLGKRLGEEL